MVQDLLRGDREGLLRDPEAGRGRVFVEGRFLTMEPGNPEVAALGVWGGRIVYAGPDPAAAAEAVRERARADGARGGGTAAAPERIGLGGRRAVPGLIDSHSHLVTQGARLRQLDVEGKPFEEAAAVAGERARSLPPGAWLHGRGWDQNLWPGGEWPRKGLLDRACPDNPVALERVDRYAVWLNSRALELAGAGPGTPDPPGGEIPRDPDGSPSGVLVGRAARMAFAAMPPWDGLDPVDCYLAAEAEALSLGVTTAVDCGARRIEHLAVRDACLAGRTRARFKALMPADPWEGDILDGGPVRGLRGGRFSLEGVKLFSDGSLGTRTAWLSEDYADRPGHRGAHSYDDGGLEAVLARIRDRGLQAAIHVIGDAAADQAVRAMARVLGEGAPARRWRLEHLQIVPMPLARRIAALGLVPSVQTVGLMTDLHMAPARLGEGRLPDSYCWRRLLDLGCVLVNGSDAPIESPNPFLGIYAACSRRDLEGRPPDGFRAGDALTVREALASYTVWPAWASFCEGELGVLGVGAAADLAVLDRDPTVVPVGELPGTRTVMTVVGGAPVWASPDF
jgi:predicted amidohydrolase YtcJ